MTPERIGRYEILRILGRGAMGIVYLARDPHIEREIALKTIRFDHAEGSFNPEEAKARFLKEAKISGRLQHPHIVTIFDVGEDSGMLYLAMEYVPGGSFSQRLADPPSFLLPERIRIVAEVAEALGHAHERGVLHRDVKPANILLSPELSAKVTDFGIGKLLVGDSELTSTGQMVGSPAYMSPEQIKGEKLDARSDIFSLGVVLYQAITLRKPFPADTLTTLVYQILHEEPPDPSTLRADLSPEFTGILRRCLAKKRDDRYVTATELASDLRAVLGEAVVGRTAGMNASRMAPVPASSAETEPTTQPTPAIDTESPTITTGRRMGEAVKQAQKDAAPPAKKKGGLPRAALVGGGVVALAVVALLLSRGGRTREAALPTESPLPVTTPASAVSLPASAPAEAMTPAVPPPAAIAETPVAEPSPTQVARKTPKLKSTTPAVATPLSSKPVMAVAAANAKSPTPVSRTDFTYSVRRIVKVNVSPAQARVFLDGKYIGISDDWDGAGGGALLAFYTEGNHRLRMAYPGYRDMNVDVLVRSNAPEEKVEIEHEMEKGIGEGPPGPAGTFRRPHYRTVRGALFKVEPPEAVVTVDGTEMGPASKWVTDELFLGELAVHDVVLSAPGHEPMALRVLVAPTTGEIRAVIKEKLKKLK
jgi:hypothetical protein